MPARKRFRGKGRYFRPERASGLAVVDVPQDVATALGGLRQLRVKGAINGVDFVSNTMPAGGGSSLERQQEAARLGRPERRGRGRDRDRASVEARPSSQINAIAS